MRQKNLKLPRNDKRQTDLHQSGACAKDGTDPGCFLTAADNSAKKREVPRLRDFWLLSGLICGIINERVVIILW